MNISLRNLLAALLGTAMLLGCAASQMHRKGLADVERGNYEDGVSELTAAVEHDPNNLSYKLDLTARREASIQKLIPAADALRGAGQLDAALSTYRRVLVINPDDQRALRG